MTVVATSTIPTFSPAAAAAGVRSERLKDASIETLRGIAIVLMVAGHVIGSGMRSGMHLPPDSIYRYLYFSFEHLRMPLFTVISGWVYCLRPLGRSGAIPRFLQGKARRLLFPLVTVGTLQYVAKSFVPGVNEPHPLDEIWRIYVFPFDQFWFLQSIFLVFVTISCIEHWGWMDTASGWVACFAGALATSLWMPRFTDAFGWIGFLYLLPFFVLGCGLHRYPALLTSRRVVIPAFLVFFLSVDWQQAAWFHLLPITRAEADLTGLGIAIGGCVLLFALRRPWRPLAWLGGYSYAIYLFHVFGTAATRIAAGQIGMSATFPIFAASLVMGLSVGVLAERLILPIAPARRAFLGLR